MNERADGTRILMLALRRALLLIVKAIEEVYGKADPIT
jgi:hypothetical protein